MKAQETETPGNIEIDLCLGHLISFQFKVVRQKFGPIAHLESIAEGWNFYFKFTQYHNGCFWGFLSKKYLRQISILGTKK